MHNVAAYWNKNMENKDMYQGDMVLTPDQRKAVTEGSFSYGSVTYGRWTNGIIPYQIENSIGSAGRSAIMAAIADYHRYTCLRFRPRNRDSNYISFYRGGGCSSPVGITAQLHLPLEEGQSQPKIAASRVSSTLITESQDFQRLTSNS